MDGAATAGLGRNLNRIPISRVLGLSEDGLNGRCPMQEVSMGLPAIIVPLNDLGSLKRCWVDRERYFELVESTEAKNIFVFCPEPYEEADLAARICDDYYGVQENRATGSAAGYLARYLVKHRYFGENSPTSGSSRGTRSDAFFAVSTGEERRKRDRRLRRQEGADGREGRALVSPVRVDRKLVACPHEGEARTIGT